MYVHVCMYMYVCTCMYVHVCMQLRYSYVSREQSTAMRIHITIVTHTHRLRNTIYMCVYVQHENTGYAGASAVGCPGNDTIS